MANKLVDVSTKFTGFPFYAIQNEETGLYWIYCYQFKDFAEKMLGRVSPGDAQDRAANWRSDISQLVVSRRESFQS